MSFLFGTNATIDIQLDNVENRQKVTKVFNQETNTLPVYTKSEDVTGKVTITMKDKKLEHLGIKIDFIGKIEYSYDKSATTMFLQQSFDLARQGVILEETTVFPFAFKGVDKQYDSYYGKNVRLRYYLKVSILKKYTSGPSKEQEIWVVNYGDDPAHNDHIIMDVGVEKCVSIEFKYAKSIYTLNDVVLGQVYFKNVRLPLASMVLQIHRKETTGTAPNQNVDTEVLAMYELMDGAPVKGESMPIRVFLSNLELTPTYKNINNMFSVTYHLHLVLIEEDGKRYFKSCEFTLYRKDPSSKVADTNCFGGVENQLKDVKRKKHHHHKDKKEKKERKEKKEKKEKKVEEEKKEEVVVQEEKVETVEKVEEEKKEDVVIEEKVEEKKEDVVVEEKKEEQPVEEEKKEEVVADNE